MGDDLVDPFWLEDPFILLRQDRIVEFYITCDMSSSEKLNALVRFFIYISIILALYNNNVKYLFLVIIAMTVSIFIHTYMDQETENFNTCENAVLSAPNEHFTEPTLNNPFMNPNVMDNTPNKPPAIDYSTKTEESLAVKNKIKTAFDYNLFQDIGDLFSDPSRQFYTVPNTDIGNSDHVKFFYGNNLNSSKTNTYTASNNLYEPPQNKRHIN